MRFRGARGGGRGHGHDSPPEPAPPDPHDPHLAHLMARASTMPGSHTSLEDLSCRFLNICCQRYKRDFRL